MIDLINKSAGLWIKGTEKSDIVQVLRNQKVPKDQIKTTMQFLRELDESPATASRFLVEKLGIGIEEAKGVVQPLLNAQTAYYAEKGKKGIIYGSLWMFIGFIATIFLPGDFLYYILMVYGGIRVIKGIIYYGKS